MLETDLPPRVRRDNNGPPQRRRRPVAMLLKGRGQAIDGVTWSDTDFRDREQPRQLAAAAARPREVESGLRFDFDRIGGLRRVQWAAVLRRAG